MNSNLAYFQAFSRSTAHSKTPVLVHKLLSIAGSTERGQPIEMPFNKPH